MKVSPSDINVGDRVRQNIDEGLHELVASIRELGQLAPVLVDSDWNLIAGHRRLRACELLGIEVDISITTSFEDAGRKLLAERDENTCRKPFTPSEAVEMARRIETVLKPAAKQRMEAGHNQHTEGSAKFAEGSTGETREIAAAATGYSRESIRKAGVVKDAAESPDAPAEVVAAKAEMDATGKVDSAYKAVKAATSSKAMSLANEAIGHLEKIPKNDPLRVRGLESVENFIEHVTSTERPADAPEKTGKAAKKPRGSHLIRKDAESLGNRIANHGPGCQSWEASIASDVIDFWSAVGEMREALLKKWGYTDHNCADLKAMSAFCWSIHDPGFDRDHWREKGVQFDPMEGGEQAAPGATDHYRWSILDDVGKFRDLIRKLESNWETESYYPAEIAGFLRQAANEIHPDSNPAKKEDAELTVDDLLAKVQALPRADRKRFIGLAIQKTAPPRHITTKEAELLELRLNQFHKKVDDNGGSASQDMIDVFLSEIRSACREFIKSEASIPPSWKAVQE